ncbi:MAG: glycosyltransferase [Leifsonia sp.]
MTPRVTAIIVARNGAQHLSRTLEALAAQTLRPDAIIAVDCGSTDDSARLLTEFGPTRLIAAGDALSFGDAIATGVRVTAPPTSTSELLWLLAQDNAPEPEALAELVAALETAPSVAVAGPKQVDWDTGDTIRSLGESMTRYGATVPLVTDELDQGQRDGLSDVLGVAAGGMLVRHTVWDALGGFDPGLPVVDDALDFSVRARLAGHRVSVAPAAHVATAGDGIAGASTSLKGRVRRRRTRLQRTAQLHRRLAYAPAATVPLHWLSLVPLALLRSIVALLAKQPGRIGGEIAAAFTAAFTGISTGSARRSIARTRAHSWAVIAPLRVSPAEMRRRRALAREARIARARGERSEVGFLTTGGAWTILAAIVVGLVVASPLLGADAADGGGLLPLSSPAVIWQSIGYGWRDISVGFVGAADPFTAVLAVVSSLTFWSPTVGLLALWIAAVPLAALGAWFAATRITERGGLRAIAAILWMLAPTFLTAVSEGRPAPVIAHILLPWLVFAAFAAPRSWSASATSALLFTAIVACAPSLAPALLIAWLVLLVTSRRGFFRIAGIPIPAAVLIAPLVWDQVLRSNWIAIVADPGVPLPSTTTPSVWQLLLGFPGGQFGGWDTVLDHYPVGALSPQLLVPILLAPLAILGLAALFLRGFRSAAFSLGLAALGFATALAATLITVATTGSQVVPVWPGSGLSLYWLGITGAVIVGLDAIPQLALLPGIVATVLFVAAAAPLALSLPLGQSAVDAGSARVLPAFVSAAARSDPRAGTLAIIPQPDGGVLADLQRGTGTTLDDQATLLSTDLDLSERQAELATLTGNLASRSAYDAATALDDERIRFVLLEPATRIGGEVTPEAQQTVRRATAALDGNPVLVPVGKTAFGALWRVDTDEKEAASAAIPEDAGGWLRTATFIAIIVVFGATLLLSIPTGVGRELPPQSARARAARQRRSRRDAKAAALAAAASAEPGADDDEPDAGSGEDAGTVEPDAEIGEPDAEAGERGQGPEGDADQESGPEPEPESGAEPEPNSEPQSVTQDATPAEPDGPPPATPTTTQEEKRDVD